MYSKKPEKLLVLIPLSAFELVWLFKIKTVLQTSVGLHGLMGLKWFRTRMETMTQKCSSDVRWISEYWNIVRFFLTIFEAHSYFPDMLDKCPLSINAHRV